MSQLIGRINEQEEIRTILQSDSSEFVAIYGRRRVGKTFLIRQMFKNSFFFEHTGMSNATMKIQLQSFEKSLQNAGSKSAKNPINWFEAFDQLKQLIDKKKSTRKKVLFLDELPWLDTPKSGFISALEHFWNGWAAHRSDILLIVCGSSTSWMINKLINNKGGLHNRITRQIKLQPFSLSECEMFVKALKFCWSRYDIAECYMVLGGIPYYWSLLTKGLSVSQNIDKLFFNEGGVLRNEINNLYAALFQSPVKYLKIVECLAKKRKGLTRDELIKEIEETSGGGLSIMLVDLENSDFIRSYFTFDKKSKNKIFQLTDFYSSFYFHFLDNKANTTLNTWSTLIDNTTHRAWAGYTFELLCLMHIKQIKQALSILGIYSTDAAWISKQRKDGVQIDLLIDRNDHVINLCEIKHSMYEFTIDKNYSENLRRKLSVFKEETKTNKSVFLTMITTYGIKQNEYSGIIQKTITMADMFVL